MMSPLRRRGSDIVRPPKYARVEHRIEHFGDVRIDPYHWLRDGRSSEARKMLRRENASMKSAFTAYGGKQLSRTLYNQMRARWKEDEVSLPWRDRSYWYYHRSVPNADYPVYCRRPACAGTATFVEEVGRLWAQNPQAPLPTYEDEVVLFDLNLFVREFRLDHAELGDMEISPDEQQLAVAIDCSNGREIFTIFILEITNVNFERWLKQHSELGRAWAAAMRHSKQSIYSSPTSALPRCSSSRAISTVNGFTFRPVRKAASSMDIFDGIKGIRSCKRDQGSDGSLMTEPPREPPECLSSFSVASPPCCLSGQKSRPCHKVKRRIDVFDAAEDVLWLSSTTLLYLALDEKVRPYRVVFHDLTKDADSPFSDIVCFEEHNEAFTVSSLCYSADEKFVMFTSSSGGLTQVYIIPCDTGRSRWVSGVPVVSCSSAISERERYMCDDKRIVCGPSSHVSVESEPNSSSIHECMRANAAVFRFCDQAEEMEFDLDHHSSLFSNSIGAWLIVITSTVRSRDDYRVAYVLDDDMLWDERQNRPLSSRATWRALFAHDPQIYVDSVECLKDLLLLSVHRGASSTVLLVPIHKIWSRWAAKEEAGSDFFAPLSLRDDALDLRAVVCYPLVSVSDVSFSLEMLYRMQRREQEQKELAAVPGEPDCIHFLRSYHGEDDFSTRTWRVVVGHPIIPSVTYSCTLDGGEGCGINLRIKKLYQVPVGGVPFSSDDYDAAVVWVPSDYAFRCDPSLQMLPTKEPADVVGVPVYLCWKKSLMQRGGNPLYLTVYGSYGECCDVEFESERLALLDRGFVWGAAAVRGGGELGGEWRDAGRKLQKGTTVNDFVSVASFLQKTGWCAEGRLVVSGSSAGGFVVMAAMNAAPQLFLAVIATVPFVDCLTTLLDPTLPLTVAEWEEFGNPLEDAEAYRILRALSPMDNLPPPGVVLPHIMMLTARHDVRVGYWESLALTARLRERREKERASLVDGSACDSEKLPERAILHYCDFGVGHTGVTGRYQQLNEIAREYAFVVLVQKAADTLVE